MNSWIRGGGLVAMLLASTLAWGAALELIGTGLAPRISGDGQHVAYRGEYSGGIVGDLYLLDRESGQTTLLSSTTHGGPGNFGASKVSLSANGRFVAFDLGSTGLDDLSNVAVWVRDQSTGRTTRVSVSTAGVRANDQSRDPAISADGRYVAFHSWGDNLVSGDAGDTQCDVFVRDLVTSETTRVSRSSTGGQGNNMSAWASISGDGRYVAFQSKATNLVAGDTNGEWDVFVYDRTTGTTTRVSVSSGAAQANQASRGASISADGRYVAFQSEASNLVPNDTNGVDDVFVHDRVTGQTTRVSVSTTGIQANLSSDEPAVSGDGHYVAFRSSASNLVANDTNAKSDIFLHDLTTGQTSRVSAASGGEDLNGLQPSISTDGHQVAFAGDVSVNSTGRSLFVYDADLAQPNAPTAPTAVTITPSSPGLQDLRGSASGSTDPEGRPLAYDYEWARSTDGGSNWDAWGNAGQTLPADRVRDGDWWRVRARAAAGGVRSGWTIGSSVTIRAVVAAVTPLDGTINVPQGQSIVVTFRWPVDQASAEAHFRLLQGTTNVPGAFSWAEAERKLVFVPTDELVAGASHTVKLLSGVTLVAGRVLNWEETPSTFSTALIAPTAVSVTPKVPGLQPLYAAATGGSAGGGYEYEWSKSADGGSNWESWGNTGRILPADRLALSDLWRARARVKDGASLSEWVESDPVTIRSMVAAVTPLDGTTNVYQRQHIVVTFRWPVDQASAEQHFRLLRGSTNLPGTFTWVQANRKMMFVRPNKLVACTEHTVKLLAGIKLLSGRTLNWEETPSTFTTAASPTVASVTLAAAPTAAGASLTVNLSAAATVRTVITNIAGRVVAELPERDLPAGVSSLLWNGKSTTGTKVPAGRYLVRVEVKGDDGAQTSALTALQMR